MSEITLSSSTKVEALEEACGVDITLEELSEMTSEQLAAYFERVFSQAGLSEDEILDVKSKLQAELDQYYASAHDYREQLESMMASGNLSSGEAATVEVWMERLDDIMTMLTDTIADNVDEALDEIQEKIIKADAGTTESLVFENPQNGEVYTVTFSEAEASETGSSFNSDANKGFLDLDSDGYYETNPDENNDGIADEDFNGDLVIDENDMTYMSQTTSDSVVNLPKTDSSGSELTYYVESYDSETGATRLKVINEDGKVFYVEVEGATKFTGAIPVNYAEQEDELLSSWYEDSSAVHSLYYFVHGEDPEVSGDFYSHFDMADYTTGLALAPSSDDFSDNRQYDVTLSEGDGTADNVSLNLPSDSEITDASYDSATQTLTLTVETKEGSITITIHNVSRLDLLSGTDTIKINGATLSEDLYNDLVGDFGATALTQSLIEGIFTRE